MKIKIDQILKDENGKDAQNDGKILSLRDACVKAILSPIQGDDEKVKWEKFLIWEKLRDASSEVELKVEEIALIKKCMGKVSSQLIMGQCFRMIEEKGE